MLYYILIDYFIFCKARDYRIDVSPQNLFTPMGYTISANEKF